MRELLVFIIYVGDEEVDCGDVALQRLYYWGNCLFFYLWRYCNMGGDVALQRLYRYHFLSYSENVSSSHFSGLLAI